MSTMEERLRSAVENNEVDEVRRIVEGIEDIDKESLSEFLVLACKSGSDDSVKYLLTVDGIDVNYKDDDGYNAFRAAAEQNDKDLIKLLLSHPSVENRNDKVSETLIFASWHGSYETVEHLLSSGETNVNHKDEDGDTALHLAAKYDRESVVKLLLEQPGVDVHAGDNEKTTVLMHAAMGGNTDILKMIISHIRKVEEHDEMRIKAKLNVTDGNGLTAIQWATHKEHTELVKTLTEAGADINIKDNLGLTALISASESGLIDIVKYLLMQPSINYNEKDEKGRTAVMMAGSDEIEDLFLSGHGVIRRNDDLDVSGFNKVQLIQAAAHGSLKKVETILENEDIDVNAKNAEGFTALICAAMQNHHEVADVLLTNEDIDVNAKDNQGHTALIWAVGLQATEIVRSLLKNEELDVNARNSNGMTALMLAVTSSDVEIIVELLKATSIDVNAKMNDGSSALLLAHKVGNIEIVKIFILLDSVFDIDISGDDRHEIGRIIAELGETDHKIWDELLDGGSEKVLSLLILMAIEITSNKIEDQTGFWKYILQNDKAQKYLNGENVDQEGNTIFHYCASNKSGKDGIKILQLLSNQSYSNLHERVNKNKDTILHVAMKNKRNDVFDQLMIRFNKNIYGSYLYPWLGKILNAKNIDENTFLSIAIKSGITDDTVIDMMDKMFVEQVLPLCEACDRDKNTILHLAMKFARNDLVPYLAKKPVQMMQQNIDGQTALHVAVRQNNVNTVNIFYESFKNRKVEINQTTSQQETSMHIAAKKGSTEMMELLVDLGGDYAARDEDGNTPLHDLLQLMNLEASEEDQDKVKLFYDAWKAMVDNCVIWWSKRLKRSVPDKDSNLYREMRHDAMYSLRSEITNNEGLSVLEYAATLGLPECVQIMLTHRNVFVFHGKNIEENVVGEKQEKKEKLSMDDKMKQGPKNKKTKTKYKPSFEIEVSNLMPEYRGKIQTTYDTPFYGRKLRNILKKKTKSKDIGSAWFAWSRKLKETRKEIGKRPNNFLETLSKVRPSMKVSDELGTFPMDKLAKHQWYLYEIFIILALLVHMSIMVWYTYESQTSLKGLNGTYPNRESIDATSLDFIMMIYVAILGAIFGIAFVYSKIRQKIKGDTDTYEETEILSDYIEAEGALLNSVTHFVAFIADNLSRIVPAIFVIVSILLVVFSHYLDNFSAQNYVWMKGIVILTGWIIVLILGRAYSPIYNFISVLKYIFVKNMVPFLLFYVILSIAFGCAIQLQFQLLKEETVELEEFGSISTFGNFFTSVPYVVWELFIMTEGMDTNLRHIQNVGYLFELDKYRSFFIEMLIFIYGLISTIILLNMLIAAMNTTYSDVITKQGKGWRQYQVNEAIRIRRLTLKFFDRLVQWIARARLDEETNRWYLTISDHNLKEIRAKYWKSQGEMRVQMIENKDEKFANKAVGENEKGEDFDSKATANDNMLEEILQAVQTLRNDISELKKQIK